MFKLEDGREKLYQWDSNRKLIVDDSSIDYVHFSNLSTAIALVVPVKNGSAEIPNVLLQETWDINVYAFDKDYTKYSMTFDVIRRDKPASYVYTETEVLSYTELIKRIDAIEIQGVNPDMIAAAIEKYLREHPIEQSNAPTAKVSKIGNTATITLTDSKGTTSVEIRDGKDGAQGPQGERGLTGPKGADGKNGLNGLQGIQGLTGPQGEQGLQGERGPAGKDGINGKDATINGKNVISIKEGSNISINQVGKDLVISATSTGEGGKSLVDSVNGKTGVVILGANDIAFEDGETFQQKLNNGKLKGQKGEVGPAGKDGAQGLKGDTGANGKDGYTPQKGIDYFDGKNGKDGEKGLKGDTGKAGFSPVINISKSGNITNISIQDKTGTKTATIKDGETGPQGEQGKQGPQGLAGKDGAVGPQGPEGKQGPQGLQGLPGKDGSQGAKGDSYTITESDYSAIADVVLTKLPNAEGVKY